jgi:hypothetical protein
MTDENELDARVEYLSGLAVISLESFSSGFPGVEAAVADIKSIIRSLRELERGDADSDYLAAVVEGWVDWKLCMRSHFTRIVLR